MKWIIAFIVSVIAFGFTFLSIWTSSSEASNNLYLQWALPSIISIIEFILIIWLINRETGSN